MCPLCKQRNLAEVIEISTGSFHLCRTCKLIHRDSSEHLDSDSEKARYETHNNTIENYGYVDFLNRALEPSSKFLTNTSNCLDYGCGPGPVLKELLSQQGINCDIYDPFFFPDKPWVTTDTKYDCIYITECFEHFYDPEKELDTLLSLLKTGGHLVVMTEQYDTVENFRDWYYTRDPTHVCFSHSRTFDWICKKYSLTIVYNDNKRVIILEK